MKGFPKLSAHSDAFADLVMLQMTAPRGGWDSLSENEEEGRFGSADECGVRCFEKEECRQYFFDL
jgi:hypothetical protein